MSAIELIVLVMIFLGIAALVAIVILGLMDSRDDTQD
jgi:type II secretory pathway pseudopilin PulG